MADLTNISQSPDPEAEADKFARLMADIIEAAEQLAEMFPGRWPAMVKTKLQETGTLALFMCEELRVMDSTSVDAKNADTALLDCLRGI